MDEKENGQECLRVVNSILVVIICGSIDGSLSTLVVSHLQVNDYQGEEGGPLSLNISDDDRKTV